MKTLTSSQRTALRGFAAVLFVLLVIAWLAFITGCSFAQWRVFQKKVPTETAAPAEQIEGQRRAAAYIAKRTASPVVNAPAVVADVHDVAVSLSASLGEPAKPVAAEDREAVVKSLSAGLRAKEEQLERWKAFGRKYGGQPIEGTGINLAGPAGLLGLLATIAACVFIPGFGWMLLRLIPVLWAAVKRGAQALERLGTSAPAALAEVKAALPQREDAARKLIRWAKRRPLVLSP